MGPTAGRSPRLSWCRCVRTARTPGRTACRGARRTASADRRARRDRRADVRPLRPCPGSRATVSTVSPTRTSLPSSSSNTGTEIARAGTAAGNTASVSGAACATGPETRSSRAMSRATAIVATRNRAATNHSSAEPRRARTGVACMAASVSPGVLNRAAMRATGRSWEPLRWERRSPRNPTPRHRRKQGVGGQQFKTRSTDMSRSAGGHIAVGDLRQFGAHRRTLWRIELIRV